MARACIQQGVSVASVVLATVLFLPMGCSSTSEKAVTRSEQAVESISAFRQQLVDANAQLGKTMVALDNLMNGSGDRKQAFSTYSREVSNLQSEGADARARSEDLQARAQEYITKWEQDVSTVSSPELRAQADARRAQVRDRIDEVQSNAAAAGSAFRPLMQKLTDIQTVLANDLTPSNINGVAPVAAGAREDAKSLKRSLDAFIAEIDTVQSGIGPRATGG